MAIFTGIYIPITDMKLAVYIYFLTIQTIATDNSLKLLPCFLVGLPRWEICDWNTIAKSLLL